MKTHPSPLRFVAALGAAITLTLTACGGDDDAGADGAEARDATSSADVVDDGAAATITIADFTFAGVTEVSVGSTVVVTNTDSAQHTWSAVDGTFDSGALGQDDSFEFTFTEAGEFEYFCNFHPSMTGTIVVTA